MKKNRRILLVIVLLIITNIITFGLTNIVSFQFNNKVILPKSQFNEMQHVYNNFSKVLSLEGMIKENYLREVDEEKLFEGQLKGLVQSLEDPYSQYMTVDEFAAMNEQTSGVFGGIGVIVTPGEDNLITVVSPIEDTPGERAGLKTGDKIIKVEGVEYTADEMDKAVKVMKGEPKTKVNLTIMRKEKSGNNKIIEMEIIRDVIRLVTVKSNIIDDNIGYIRLTSFDEITYDDFVKDLKALEKQKVEGLIIDLRGNPGGLLSTCIDITDELLGEADIVYTEDKNNNREYFRSKRSQTDLPLVLLVNGGSASASEILAGAIKDNKRGELVGETTFGKGVVQRLKPFPDGSGLKLTISEYFTPNGINIHGIGIEPDYVVELPDNIEEIGVDNIKEDTQLQKALEVLKEKIK